MLANNLWSCDSVRAIEFYRVRKAKSDANKTLPPVSTIHYNTSESIIQCLSRITARFIPHIDTYIIPQRIPKYKSQGSNTMRGKEYR